jgi:hypothetical protein
MACLCCDLPPTDKVPVWLVFCESSLAQVGSESLDSLQFVSSSFFVASSGFQCLVFFVCCLWFGLKGYTLFANIPPGWQHKMGSGVPSPSPSSQAIRSVSKSGLPFIKGCNLSLKVLLNSFRPVKEEVVCACMRQQCLAVLMEYLQPLFWIPEQTPTRNTGSGVK